MLPKSDKLIIQTYLTLDLTPAAAKQVYIWGWGWPCHVISFFSSVIPFVFEFMSKGQVEHIQQAN